MKKWKTKLCSMVLASVMAAGIFAGASLDAEATADTTVRSVYTNEPVTAAQASLRPIAVMMPTDKVAQPSYGIGSADVLYEIMEEGNISRQMAIISNWQGLPQIGNLRSCRLYYIPAAKEWDPILIHFGGVFYMQGTIDAPDMNNLSGTYEYGVGGATPGSGYFYRTQNRKAPHNAYISADGIQKACAQLGYQMTVREGYYNSKHFTFAEGVNTLEQYGGQAATANVIDLSQVFSYTKSSLTYDSRSASEGRPDRTADRFRERDRAEYRMGSAGCEGLSELPDDRQPAGRLLFHKGKSHSCQMGKDQRLHTDQVL